MSHAMLGWAGPLGPGSIPKGIAPRRQPHLWKSLRAILILMLTGAVCFTSPVSAVEESREIVFERDPDIDYPDYERCFWKVICVDCFVGNSGHRFHFPATVQLNYNAEECYTGNSNFQLDFRINPFDGPGLEYDMERGIKFEIDYTIGSWGHKYGDDFEENFAPPLQPTTLEYSDVTANLFEKSVKCLGGIALNLYSTEKFTGDRAYMTLRITDPPGGMLVKFNDTGTDTTILELTAAATTVSKSLDITTAFAGATIEITAELPVFSITHNESVLEPGVDVKVHKTALSCGWNQCDCWHHGEYILHWYSGSSTTRNIQLDESESEELVFQIANDPEGYQPPKEAQDAAADAQRAGEENAPRPEAADTIIALIHNIYDYLCARYDSLRVDYSLFMTETPVLLGSHLIDAADARLYHFNYGLADTVVDTFLFEPGHPDYPFWRDFAWGDYDINPRYLVQITPYANQSECPSWTVAARNFTTSSNDRAIVPFERPLPDFSVDSVYIDGPSMLDFGDTVACSVYVSNAGISWPVTGLPPDLSDLVPITARASYEHYVLNEDSIVILTEPIGEQTLTPLDHNGNGTYYFQYTLPDLDTLRAMLPLKVRILFEINDGAAPVDWVVWERSFENNRQDVVFWLADIPQLALPSAILPAADGQPIDTGLPRAYTDWCPCDVYLYVNDESFSYDVPNVPPPALKVQMGAGEFGSKPTDSTWTWIDASFLRDYTDDLNRKFKVYRADACQVQGGMSLPADPEIFLFVDYDGASMVDTMVNLYYRDSAGVLKPNETSLDSSSYCFRTSLDPNPGCCLLRGDVDGSGVLNVADLTFLIAYLFRSGPPPECTDHGDVNGDGSIKVSDLTFLIAYLFRSGPPPVPCG